MTETVTRKDIEPEIDEELLAEAMRRIGTSLRNEAVTVTKADTEPEVDEELLAEAMRQLGLSSRNETLNAGLRRVIEQERTRRRRARENLRRMSEEGVFDYDALAEVDR
jgi:Arc/MetJ family transcription regulator